jgi:hypothetical protein
LLALFEVEAIKDENHECCFVVIRSNTGIEYRTDNMMWKLLHTKYLLSILLCLYLSATAQEDVFFNVNSNRLSRVNNSTSSAGGKRDIIAMLVRNTERAVPAIKKQLNMIDKYLRDDFAAELVVMHDGYFHSKQLDEIRQSTKRAVEFVNVDVVMLRMPKGEYQGIDPYLTDPNWSKNAKWSYHQMIRFWLYDVFRLSTMYNVEYFLRMDDDSVFQEPVNNLFKLMREKKGTGYFLCWLRLLFT